MLTNKNNDKYIMLEDDTIEHFGIKLYRIQAIKDFSNVKVGDLGGYIEKEANLSHYGNAWAFDDALVFGNAKIWGDAVISGNAKIWGDVVISGNAKIWGDAVISGNAEISGNAVISGNAKIYGNAKISGNAKIYGNTLISGNAKIYGNTEISGNALISGNAKIYGDAEIWGNAEISGNAEVYGNAEIWGDAVIININQWFCIENVGSRKDIIRFYETAKNIYVSVGCFKGTLLEFEQAIEKTHSNTIYEKEYKSCIELAKIKLLNREEYK